jgi:hypothetical protein
MINLKTIEKKIVDSPSESTQWGGHFGHFHNKNIRFGFELVNQKLIEMKI